jgi:hypothetical protein
MDYDSVILVLSLMVVSFLFGRYFSSKPSDASNVSQLRGQNDSSFDHAQESPLAVAIKTLIERNDLGDALAADTTTVPGQFIWTRTLLGKTRGIRFAEPGSPQTEYTLAYFDKDGDKLVDGKWMWDLEHSVAAFARFLIEWEDRRAISNDNLEYLHKRVQIGKNGA